MAYGGSSRRYQKSFGICRWFSALGGVSRAVMKILRALLKHDVHGLLYAHKSWSPVRSMGRFVRFVPTCPNYIDEYGFHPTLV